MRTSTLNANPNANVNPIIKNNPASSNIINIENSIEDEPGNDWRRSNLGGVRPSSHRSNNRQNLPNDNEVRCPDCRFDFNNIYELESHFPYCNLVRNNQAMNNRIHEILSLMQTLNQRVITDSNRLIPHLLMSEMNTFDKQSELIDWEYNLLENGLAIWKNIGKITLKESDYKHILKVEKEEIVKSRYWKKRFWLNNYIRKNILDSSFEYITLVINRENILEDSFLQFQTTMDLDLTKELKIFFVEEVAQDVGGVYREWYSNLIDAIISPKESLFYEIDDKYFGKNSFFIPTYTQFFRKDSCCEYYEFIGKIVAKAILDRMTMKVNFNIVLLKHIMGYDIILEDLRHLDYEVSHSINFKVYMSIKNMMSNTCDKENDLRFVWTIKTSEKESEEIELIEGGKEVLVDDSNKEEFSRLL